MRLIVLAANAEPHLQPSHDQPTALLDLGDGHPVLAEQLAQALGQTGIEEVVVVTGHHGNEVEARIRQWQRDGVAVRSSYHPFHAVSSSLLALWNVRYEMTEDFLLMGGDALVGSDVFADFVADTGDGLFLATAEPSPATTHCSAVRLHGGYVAGVSAGPAPLAGAYTPGLALVRGRRARAVFWDHLEHLARQPHSLALPWLHTMASLWASGVPIRPWWLQASHRWSQLDASGVGLAWQRFTATTEAELAHAH